MDKPGVLPLQNSNCGVGLQKQTNKKNPKPVLCFSEVRSKSS